MKAYLAVLAALVLATRASNTDKRQTTGPACIKQDIVYMIDSSKGIGIENFLQQLEFVKENIKHYNINPSCTRVGIVTYSQGAYNKFYLDGYSTQQQLLNAIGNIVYTPGTTSNTAEAINYVTNTAFSTQHGARSGVPHYGILVSGSTSSSPTLTVAAANHARQNGVTLYSVGVGQGINQGELVGVAKDPKNYFSARNFNSLGSLAQPVATSVNGAVTPASAGSLGTPSSCLQQADIVFLVDGSGSIGASNFVKLENFVKGIVSKLDVGANKVHVGLMQFSNYPSKEFPLNMYSNRQDVMTGIQNMHYMGGGTNTADAIKYMRQNMFAQSGGARPNVPRIGVVITDGRSASPPQTQTEANNARADHISMMAIGVGNGVDVNELHNIADDPDSANTFQVANYDQLDGIVASIVNRACQVRTTASPSSLSGASSQGTGSILNDTCRDAIPDCSSYDKSVCHGTFEPWSKTNCRRYCGHCNPLYTTGPPPCADKLSNCASYEASSCIGVYKPWAIENCRQYCGYCDALRQSVGFYGTCYYKGKKYSLGEKWNDGCDYECTCEDVQTGKYQCYNKCPVYYNLPSACTLVKKDSECCLQPVCNFQPTLSSFEATMTGKTPDGIDVCVYKGNQYYEGQSWEDGCQYVCTCKDAKVGTYKCQDSCATYSSLPSYCHMVKKPGECCSKPVCEFKTQQGSFNGMGTISGHGIGQSPTAPPPCVDVKTDCDMYETGFCENYKPWARDYCRKTCNLCVENAPNPGPTDVCIYDGRAFKQDQSWEDGCDTVCTCENAVYGYYRCVNSCPTYTNLPSGCREVKNAGECCSTVQCGSGTFLSSTNNLGSIGNGGLINVGNSGVRPTVPSGGIAPPGTGGTVFQAPTLKGCLYKGTVHSQNEIWQDGCQYTCECQDANTGLYSCKPKCPLFPVMPSQCKLETNPNDPCCQRPVCQFTGSPVAVPPVYRPSVTGHNVVEPPLPSQLYHGTQTLVYQFTVPGNTPAPATGSPVTSGGIGYCQYKGQQYSQSQRWEDGCAYNCECENAATGFYRCREKCPKYTSLPPQCHLEQDKNNICCQVPVCIFDALTTSMTNFGTGPHLITTPRPQPQTTTQKLNVCTYKGHYYSQGQAWYDACDYKCSCDDSTTGFYRCMRRCPEYFNVPPGCPYVPDPNDPTCCRVPQCTPTPAPGAISGAIPTIPPGTFTGQAPGTGYVGYCEYKGGRYKQGVTWSDGCDYNCVCENESSGRYKCQDKCPSYAALPSQCRLIPDFANPCCMKPDCSFTTTSGQISGHNTPTPPIGSATQSLTPAPKANVCVYKTAQYSQDQEWNDGCQYKCRCDDSSRGLYVCNERCPRYQNPLPSQCKMVTDPSDTCCLQPKCTFIPSPGQITGTIAPNMLPTKLPGIISGQANTPAPTPRPDGSYPSPQPLSFCEYKGSRHSQDQTWDDGCDYSCRCVNARQGRYECTEKCPKYTNLPQQCHLTKDPANPCCFKPTCDFPITAGQLTGQITPAPIPGQSTVAPTPRPTLQPQPSLPSHVCVYRSDKYTQGQQWFDGCNFKCLCEDAERGIYRCSERCAKYPSLPSGCTLVADPADPLCCEVPQCTPSANSSIPFPTAPPGHVTGGSVTPAPTLKPGLNPTPAPGVSTLSPPLNPTGAPQPKAVCVYKGKQYAKGQRWQDGCDYNCVCQNADTGMYECTEMCAKYPNLPPECHLVQDYLKPCCKTPVCNFKGSTGQVTGQNTPAPLPGISTLAPSPGVHPSPGVGPTLAPTPKKLCSYNGVSFRQGQRWDDGCDLQCVCEDETVGYYRCNQRCAKYPNLPAGCTLATDQSDPCCRVPVCSPTPAPNPGNTVAPSPGGPNPTLKPGMTQSPNITPPLPTLKPVIIGQGVTPTPTPGVSTAQPPIPVCVYYGKKYGQGEKWRDGCQYICECTDAHIGQYKCTERCAIYTNLPPNCRMVTDPADSCCKKAECSPTPAPTLSPPQGSTPAPQPGVGTLAPQPGVSTLAPQPGVSTMAPQPGIQTPGPQPTPQPRQVCVMNGVQYTQGQKWNDGCDKVCVCDDGTTGHYTCSDRCKIYPSIPKGCTMVPDPADPLCCQVPSCIPVPGTNGVPTPGPTDKPVIYTNAPHAVVTGHGTPPAPTRAPTPSPRPGVSPGTTLAPLPRAEVCVYKGQQYLQDQKWKDGCQFDCICNDGKTGQYTCTERCGTFPNLPPQCTLQRDPNDYCCYVPVCDWSKPTPGPNPPGPQPTLSPHPGVSTIAPQPGFTVAPSPGTNQTPAPKLAFCVYNGVAFKQGQVLDDGCTQRCRCDNADTNYYNCYDRCAIYPVKPSCVMVTDPQDSCCQIPKCTFIPTPGPNITPAPSPGSQTQTPNVSPGLNPTLGPTPGPNPYPSPIPTAVPGQIISKPDPTRPPQQRGFCQYNAVKYTKGQTWDDGCSYKCECLDDMTGQYKCTERCPRYPNIPSYCVMVEDPNDKCCKVPSCPGLIPTAAPNQTPSPIPGVYSPTPGPGQPTQAPHPGSSTIAPSPGMPGYVSPNPHATPVPIPTPQPSPVPRDVCIMNGKSYTQGQRWYDGCKQTCICDNGVTGHYTCNSRCKTFSNIQPTCVFVPDPNDPICCQMPQCTSPNSTIPTPIKGSISGGNNPTPTPRPSVTLAPNPLSPVPTPGPGLTYPPGMIHTQAPKPGSTVAPNPFGHSTAAPVPQPKVCVYKGSQYSQGQTWRDGCLYDCTCEDADQGRYTCTDVCPVYPGLPAYCRMVYDPMNPCCKKPDCSTQAPSPHSTPAPIPGVSTPAPIPGVSTVAPTPGPNPVPKVDFCVYNGIPLKQGQTFADGCDKNCRCEDTMSNAVVCNDRCATFPPLPGGCYMVTDPNDQCCQVPHCQPTNPGTNPNSTIVTGVPGTITGSNLPNPNPGTQPVTGTRDVCLYHGIQYKTGTSWDDGCTYNCICVDGKSGNYRCTEKCARYTNIPSFCTMIQDPNDACCRKPKCQTIAPTPAPNHTPAPHPGISNPTPQPGGSTVAPQPGSPTPQPGTLTPRPGGPTPAPTPGGQPTPAPRMACQYNNQYYQQSQVWYDGCNAKCRCDDASTGHYVCQQRCATYPQGIPASCTLVPDPKDPSCCKVASCPLVPTAGPNPTPGYLVPNPNTPAPPVITGLAPVPIPGPYPIPGLISTPVPVPGQSTIAPNPQHTVAPSPGGPTQEPNPRTGCFYKGVLYQQNQKFDDGCDYNCECIDDHTGQYKCSKRCQDYPRVPPQCVLVADPKDSCCKTLYCDFVNPTPFPHGIPTPAPQPTPAPLPGQLTPSPGATPAPVPAGYCVYKGVYYTQGQEWKDGCDKKCRCEDVTKGYISCTDRCPTFSNYGSNCVLRTDPNDNCCLIPDCNSYVTPTPGSQPSGTQPSITFNPGVNPGVTGINPGTISPVIVYPTSMPGTFTGYSGNYPSGTNPQTGPSGRTNACVYKSQVYKQSDKWDDGCSYKCECIDETRGQYKCTERCPHYVNLPPQCTYIQDPNDQCCRIARCNLYPTPQPTPHPHPTLNPQLTQNPHPTPSQGVYTFNPGYNTGPTGSGHPPITINPGTNSPVTPFTGTRDQCIYKDMTLHKQGTSWQDGCDYTCVCEDPATNSYSCNARCQMFSDLPSSCTLIPDPKDNCCKLPQCTGSLVPMTGGPTSGNPTLSPSVTNVVPIGTHTSFTGSGRPNIIPGLSSTGSRSVCYYKGTVHQQGQSWDDGCDYVCTCTDAMKGLYSCTAKCPNYPALPSYCKMNKVPGLCCPSLSCNIPQLGNYNPAPQLIPTPAPSPAPGLNPTPKTNPLQIYPGGTQPVIGGSQYPGGGYTLPQGVSSGSIRNQCVYKNKLYNQGEKWDDACDYQCECIDGKSGYYQCKPLCPTYSLPQGCYLKTLPGQCCMQPMCQGPGGTQINPLTNPTSQYPVYGSYTSGKGGFRPGYNPSYSSVSTSSGSSNRCIYNGRIYSQGQTWDDGCDYACQCTDAQHGLFTCNDKCQTYTKLPPSCHMVTLPGQCCEVVECNQPVQTTIATPFAPITPSPPVSGCYDAISNCAAYGMQSCNDPYRQWADKNCRAFCGFCHPNATPTSGQCFDKISNCQAYGQSACTGIYAPWARDNCRQYCNLCSNTQAPPVTNAPVTSSQVCQDAIPNCASYGTSSCVTPYEQWAAQNCRKYCGMCNVTGTPATQTGSGTNNWMIMMKGVAGVPGNLYQLWNSRNTSNANVPQAMYLTSTYPGHYKPDLSNYWNNLCIDKVKVAIFNNGVEKANIIFDATGADKNSWFDQSRIISSTWNDIKYAPKNLFSMIGDPSTGRQFYASNTGSGCNAKGWIMVSTQSGCVFEQGSQKPAFYYAPGQGATNWASTTPGTGDVFAILAHSNCNFGQGFTNAPTSYIANSTACLYKGKIYSQGQNWQDGCNYNCTCEDAVTGFYRCFDLCPTWTNLPAGCTLQKAAGDCCSKPVCPQGGGFTNQSTLNTCYYNGNYYHEGEKWRDGCKYNCQCIDGKNGQYQCNALCLQWSNLPSVCHMEVAAAGKCCPKAVCPSYVQLQYPPGYVEPDCPTPCPIT